MPSGAAGKRRTKWRRAVMRAQRRGELRARRAQDERVVRAAVDAASATGELIEERRPLVEWERRAGRWAWGALAALAAVVLAVVGYAFL